MQGVEMPNNTRCELYFSQLKNRLQSPELGFSLSTADKNHWFASKLGLPFKHRQYSFVIARVDGASQTPETLEHFIDESFNISYLQFKREFNFFSRLFLRELVSVPVMVSDSSYSRDVISEALAHKDRDWNVREIPTLIQTQYDASRRSHLNLQLFGRGAETNYPLIERALNINAAFERSFSFRYSIQPKLYSMALAVAGTTMLAHSFLYHTSWLQGSGQILLTIGVLGTLLKTGD